MRVTENRCTIQIYSRMLRDKMTVLGLLVHVTSYYDLLSEIINLALCWPRGTHPKLQTIVKKSYLRTHGDG